MHVLIILNRSIRRFRDEGIKSKIYTLAKLVIVLQILMHIYCLSQIILLRLVITWYICIFLNRIVQSVSPPLFGRPEASKAHHRGHVCRFVPVLIVATCSLVAPLIVLTAAAFKVGRLVVPAQYAIETAGSYSKRNKMTGVRVMGYRTAWCRAACRDVGARVGARARAPAPSPLQLAHVRAAPRGCRPPGSPRPPRPLRSPHPSPVASASRRAVCSPRDASSRRPLSPASLSSTCLQCHYIYSLYTVYIWRQYRVCVRAPRFLWCLRPLMWSRKLIESFTTQSHTLQ